MDNTTFKAIQAEARGWVADAFEDAPGNLSNAEIRRVIERHYEGGWDAFVANTDVSATATTYTPAEVSQAREWAAQASPRSDVSGWTPNSVYRMTDNLYPGGWGAFVRDHRAQS